jgi:hypothetical protein
VSLTRFRIISPLGCRPGEPSARCAGWCGARCTSPPSAACRRWSAPRPASPASRSSSPRRRSRRRLPPRPPAPRHDTLPSSWRYRDAGADDGEAVLTQQRSRSRGRLFGRGDDNAAAGGGGRSPSAGSWDGSSRTLEDARAEGSRRHEAAARRERALAYASACQQRHHDDKAGLGLEWLERWMAAQAPLQHAPDHAAALAGYSPDSSFTGDWTPPRLGVSTRPSRVAYTWSLSLASQGSKWLLLFLHIYVVHKDQNGFTALRCVTSL